MATSKTGTCSACRYSPVAFDAFCCPRCGAQNKRPSLADRFVGRGVLLGMAGGAVSGAALGWFSDPPGRVGATIGCALACALGGLLVGFTFGLAAALAADLFGKLTGRPPAVRPGGLIVPDPVEVLYCGHCRERQPTTDGEVCVDCGRRTVTWVPDRESEDTAHRRWADVNRRAAVRDFWSEN